MERVGKRYPYKAYMVILGVMFVIYLYTVGVHLHEMQAVLSPVLVGMSVYLVYQADSLKDKVLKGLLVGAGASWVFADVLWVYIINILKTDPLTDKLLGYLYLLPGLLLMFGLFKTLKSRVQGKQRMLVIVDITMVLFLMVRVYWIVLGGKQFQDIWGNHDDFLTLLYVTRDSVMLSAILVFYIIKAREHKRVHTDIILLSATIYALVDLVTQYQWIYGYYVIHSAQDIGYVFSFIVLGVGLNLRGEYIPERYEYMGSLVDKGWLLLVPLVLLYQRLEPNPYVSIGMLGVLLVYRYISLHIIQKQK